MKHYFLLSISFLILCCSCGEATKKTYRINQIDLTVEGPLFDGPNTLQATHVIDLNAIEPNLKADQIEAVKLIKANISTQDSIGFNNIRNFVLQLTSSDAKMEKVAVLNPVEKNLKEVTLNPSAESELLDNFQQKEIILILDADIEGDSENNLTYQGNFEFEITYKK